MTSTGQLRWPVALGLLVAVYAAGAGAVAFAPEHDPVAAWWPAAGIAVALLALSPRSWWPVLALGVVVFSGAANVTGGREVTIAVLFGLSNAAEAVVGAVVLRRDGRDRPSLESQDDFLRLVEAALLGGFTIAVGAAASVHFVGDGSTLDTWRSVFASHAASTIVLVPVAMTLHLGESLHKRWELLVQTGALAVVSFGVFSPVQSLPLTFLPLPFLVWAALRFDRRIVAWELAAFSVLATFMTVRGFGPFGIALDDGRIDVAMTGTLTQGYLLSAALMSLPLAIAVEQRRRLFAQVTDSERLFRRNFTESLVGMLLMRADGVRLQVVDLNDTAAEVLGGERDDLIGRSLDTLLETDEALDVLAGHLVRGELDGWTAQTGLRDRPGARVNVAVSPLSLEPEPVFSAQLQDVTAEYDARTEQRHNQELLEAALDKERTAVERLRQLDEAKNEFVSTVSHELRTPVTSIVGYTEMLSDGSIVDPVPAQLPMLATIARNGERLIVICNDLLLLSGLDSASAHWTRETLDLASILAPAEEAIRPMLAGRELTFRVERPDRPVVVTGDRVQLERVLTNLLGNAVKFTEDGGEVSCHLEQHDNDAWIVVRDTGIGIPEDEQGGLFQKFFRSTSAKERAIQGTGLGLSIVATIVAAHGGRIGVESGHLKGTTFTVRLPLKQPGVRP